MTFTEFVQEECGNWSNIETLIFNLMDDQVEECINDYISKYGELKLSEREKKALNIYLDLKIY